MANQALHQTPDTPAVPARAGGSDRAKRLASEWVNINKKELKLMWETQEFRKLPPLK